MDDIAARADHIQETICVEQVAGIGSSHKVSFFRHQHGGKPKGSTKGKRPVIFSELCANHVKFGENAYKCVPLYSWSSKVTEDDFETSENEQANYLK